MIRLYEFLAIVGMTGISYIGVVIAQGGKKSAIAISVVVSVALIIFNAGLEDRTGKGIIGNLYCSAVTCKSVGGSVGLASPVPPVSAGPSCDEQIAAWNVRLSDFRSQETERTRQCREVADAQTALNSEFFDLRSEWPMAISFLKDCMKKQNKDDPLTCMDAICLFSGIGGYDCKPLQNSLHAIYDRQEDYLKRYRENACTMTANSDYFDALGMIYTKPVGVPPAAPAAPICAAPGSVPART